METLKLSEQEIVNAICLHVANKRQISPEEVGVELLWDEDYGFSSEVQVTGRTQMLIEANLIEAIRFWIEHTLERNPFSAGVRLELDDEEGIVAHIKL